MTGSTKNYTIEFSFPSELGYEKIARDVVASFALRCGFDVSQTDDIKTALGEACINAIEHGNQRHPNLHVEVNCSCDGQKLTIEVYDHGLKTYAGEAPHADITSKLRGQAPRRGMGLLLISQLVDECSFVAGQDGGNCFRFAFRQHMCGAAAHSVTPMSCTSELPPSC